MPLSNATKRYIERRGWGPNDYNDVGVFDEGGFVWFPIRAYDNGVVGAIGRKIEEKSYVLRLRTSKWGYFLWRGLEDRPLFLVEGVFDLGWLLANGFHAAAYLSDTLNHAQIRILARFYRNVVIIPDNDFPGRRGAAESVTKLRRQGVLAQLVKVETFLDVDTIFATNNAASKTFVEHLKGIEEELADEGD